MKISLCMIVKDEGQNLGVALSSVRQHVDEIVIVDTGSTDNTREVAVSFGANVYQFDHKNHPEAFYLDDEVNGTAIGAPPPYSNEWTLGDFAAARNESFSRATGEYVVWMDADDVIESPDRIRDIVADMAASNMGMGFCAYNYAIDAAGIVHYRQWRERVFRRGDAKWVGAVHEVLIPSTKLPPRQYPWPTWSHKRKSDRRSTPNRNYKILLRQAKKTVEAGTPMDPRTLFYLGQEARFIDPQKAVGFYEEYLRSSGWGEERAAAHNAIGNMLEYGVFPGMPKEQAYAQANREYATSAAEMPTNPDGLFGLARIAYLRGRFHDCINYTERAFAIGNTDSMLGANPMDRLYRPHIYYNHALSMAGRVEDAIKSCEAALAANPQDPGVPGGAPNMVKNNLQVYRQELERRKLVPDVSASDRPSAVFGLDDNLDGTAAVIQPDVMAIWSMQLWKQLVAANDLERASTFLGSLPAPVREHAAWKKMSESLDRRKAISKIEMPTERADIVFFLGPAPEPWDPTTPDTKGLGGSETAAIHMARELAKLGKRVLVFAEAAGEWDGVQYLPHQVFRGCECETFIASRAPWAIEAYGRVVAKVKMLWVHDIHVGNPSPAMDRHLLMFDRIMCLSDWHKGFFLSCYPSVHSDRVVVTRNGIDLDRFFVCRTMAPTGPKKNRMVFSSSPNRGLAYLLPNFQAIRARVPDAELHIYYGFDTWETMARAAGNQPELDQIAQYKSMIDQAVKQGGVVFHGKQPQSVLATAFLEAKVWGYLTEFPETSCISAMEAMAAGCGIVCSRWAALAETVKHGVFIDNGPEAGRKFVEECTRLLTDEPARKQLGDAARAYALDNLSWHDVAKEWVDRIDTLKQALASNPMPPWVPAPRPVNNILASATP